MKNVVNISLADKSFHVDEDAYCNLKNYLDQFKSKIDSGLQKKEIMDDIERRISELFQEKLGNYKDVVNIAMVNDVIMQLGMPDGSSYDFSDDFKSKSEPVFVEAKRRLFRDPDDRVIGGVCSGLALYFSLDKVLLRVIFFLLLVLGLSGFWIYVILWIVVPKAVTPSEKCQMYGIPQTAENLSRFARNR